MANAAGLMGPTWDIKSEYPSIGSPELSGDVARGQLLIEQLLKINAQLAPLVPRAGVLAGVELQRGVAWAQEAAKLHEEAMVLLLNVETYLNCTLSVDGKNGPAKAMLSKLQSTTAELGQAYGAVRQLLKLACNEFVEAFLAAPHTIAQRFMVGEMRKLQGQALSLHEEDLILGLDVNGPQAWGNLYDNLSASIVCQVDIGDGPRAMGLAEAASHAQSESAAVRKAAFTAVGRGWQAQEESAAAIINALSGWRLSLYHRRSHNKKVHFLDEPLHHSRMTLATLNAMMGAVKEAVPLGRRVLKIQAGLLGKERLAPWDLFAPCPVKDGKPESHSFAEAIELIAVAYGDIHPDMGAFVRMMAERQWIEGTVGATKRPGAYCTHFAKSRSPRVYMTYTGGMRELKTLAHELGHAFHSWVMREMPLEQTFYPMTLAETASIFGETVVNSALIGQAKTSQQRLSFTWAQAREVESLLLNIPARFDFERQFYTRRGEATLEPSDLKQLMQDSWTSWYGDSLSEMDPMFWASKLHFSIPGLSFYNFPYTFGYLFSLGVYAQRERLGVKFYDAYVSLLRDTGRMTVEEVAAKHLGADLTKSEFWRQSIAIAERSVDQFEAAATLGPVRK